MYYALIPLAVIIITLVTFYDILFTRKYTSNKRAFFALKGFLYNVITFCIVDALWGILDHLSLDYAAYIVTFIYFAFLASSVTMWSLFVIFYLDQSKIFNVITIVIGVMAVLAAIVLLIINFFRPIMFNYVNDAYNPGLARYVFLFVQAASFFVMSLYTFIFAIKLRKSEKENHYLVVSVCGIVMVAAITLQLAFPLYPFYASGFLVSLLILHRFLVLFERQRFNETKVELGDAKVLAYKDALTGVSNNHAFVELQEKIDNLIREDKIDEFAVFVFDLNNLKNINDKYGHAEGDKYIIGATKLISTYFPNADIYRFGGDEFAVVLTDEAYENRKKWTNAFNHRIEANLMTKEPIVSV